MDMSEQPPARTGAPSRSSSAEKKHRSGLNPAWVVLVEIVRRLEAPPHCGPVGRIIFQKIAYVVTREGLPTGLRFAKCSFGPYSNGLQRVQTRLVNDNLLREQRLGSMFKLSVGPNYARAQKDYEATLEPWSALIEKTTELFSQVDTTQAEIIAAVLFVADALETEREGIPTEGQVLAAVMDWKARRFPPFSESEVASTIRNLAKLRWLAVEFDPGLPVSQDG